MPASFANVRAVSVSDQALLVQTGSDTGTNVYAYVFGSGTVIELPLDNAEAGGPDIAGDLAVWWEGKYDEATGTYTEQHVFASKLPDGPKVEIAGTDRTPGFPQVADGWVTWIQWSPYEENPEEYWRGPIYGVRVDQAGRPIGPVQSLAPSALAYVLGDSTWTYSLSDHYLAWEQALAEGGFGQGSYVLNLENMEPLWLGADAWRPSVGANVVVYWANKLQARDLMTGRNWTIDAAGDFPAAAPTYVAYLRPAESGGSTVYEVVTQGYKTKQEQVLAQQTNPPWLSPPLAVSARHVAVVTDDNRVRLFEWQAK
ncbi:MAG: hypothetical protein H5T84_03625 [Thermoleophilia bacterium]|nr:hypothetical protein [Thermoleophilia bacterium]